MKEAYTLHEIIEIVNKEVQQISYTQSPQTLFEPISYILALGGKRLRPALALIACNLYQEDIAPAMPIALGIELFHNFTLLHDDLMDRADKRRGQATVHIKWNDNTAILSGDAMLTEAYKEITKVETRYLKEIITLFSTTATEVYCGQQLDIEFEQRLDVTIPEYVEMIRLKTAVLLACAIKQGAIVAGAPEADLIQLYNFGIYIGLAFQLKDDLLDVYGNVVNFGKRIGGDILCNKKTYLLINALENADVKHELLEWIDKKEYDEENKIAAITALYNKLNLAQKTDELIASYCKLAIQSLDSVNIAQERKQILYRLTEDLMYRNA